MLLLVGQLPGLAENPLGLLADVLSGRLSGLLEQGVLVQHVQEVRLFADQVDRGKGNPQNIFKAKYTPPAPGANTPDPLAQAQPAQPATPPASDPWSTPSAPVDEPPF